MPLSFGTRWRLSLPLERRYSEEAEKRFPTENAHLPVFFCADPEENLYI